MKINRLIMLYYLLLILQISILIIFNIINFNIITTTSAKTLILLLTLTTTLLFIHQNNNKNIFITMITLVYSLTFVQRVIILLIFPDEYLFHHYQYIEISNIETIFVLSYISYLLLLMPFYFLRIKKPKINKIKATNNFRKYLLILFIISGINKLLIAFIFNIGVGGLIPNIKFGIGFLYYFLPFELLFLGNLLIIFKKQYYKKSRLVNLILFYTVIYTLVGSKRGVIAVLFYLLVILMYTNYKRYISKLTIMLLLLIFILYTFVAPLAMDIREAIRTGKDVHLDTLINNYDYKYILNLSNRLQGFDSSYVAFTSVGYSKEEYFHPIYFVGDFLYSLIPQEIIGNRDQFSTGKRFAILFMGFKESHNMGAATSFFGELYLYFRYFGIILGPLLIGSLYLLLILLVKKNINDKLFLQIFIIYSVYSCVYIIYDGNIGASFSNLIKFSAFMFIIIYWGKKLFNENQQRNSYAER